jgi:hypothetical protein
MTALYTGELPIDAMAASLSKTFGNKIDVFGSHEILESPDESPRARRESRSRAHYSKKNGRHC